MERVIMDVDTGLDDAVAIVLAAGSEQIQIEGIVAVCGNMGLEYTLENTLNVCDLLDITAPVYKGADRPLLRDKVDAGEFHGKTGLDGPVFPPRKKQVTKGLGVQYIIDTVLANPNQINLVAVGPLTDIALAIRVEPKVALLAKRIVIMGGSFSRGNVTEFAEFNTYADPEAAQIVFTSGANLFLFPLDCTMQVRLSKERLASYHAMHKKASTMVSACMDTYMYNYERFNQGLPVLHDPLCIAFLIDPTLFGLHRKEVTVELAEKKEYGRTLAGKDCTNGGVSVALQAKTEGFWALMDSALATLQ
ncbi:Inosine-uridine nucleoside N-ribohydrolase [Sphaerochaeta pleomorpha str. Grapes]|uniref:Inosine-uridine nucleoside N-ribohydrolase n=1 Tax=Sphaerochaeta pleomorpha (strain ATCC BAA-1885 / DSM 22778 / Grapes) TaxID=158190 RepID=G8QRV2_SPHPG|nr:nucleoside hydrolase [Sphaerochaeta pleomorpha]AEV28885.1 Inosine-uridine nucleoside N-ribohydrolase [Sphaerochaeta pleomorpha str. Grapes]